MVRMGRMTLVVEGVREDFYFPGTMLLDESAWRGFISLCTRQFRQDHRLSDGIVPEIFVR